MQGIIEIDSILETKIKKVWDENSLSLDIAVIDLQHLWLVSLVIELEDLFEFGEPETIDSQYRNIIDQLIDFTTEHFTVEEDLFKRISYPQDKAHTKQHRNFIEVIQKKAFSTRTDNTEAVIKLLFFLKNWLFKHIQVEDRRYKEYMDRHSIDIKNYFQTELRNENKVNIIKKHAELYSRITGRRTFVDAKNVRNILYDVYKIWSTYTLKLGLPIIDLQHLWLINLIVELDIICKHDNLHKKEQSFRNAMAELIEYSRDHFKTEELVMEYLGHPELEKHKVQHRKFITMLNHRNAQKKERMHTILFNLTMDLKEWLISHVAIDDKAISLTIKDHLDEISDYVEELKKNKRVIIKKKHIRLYAQIKNIEESKK